MPRAKPKPRDPQAFGYGRVSTNRQEISIEVQRRQTHDYYQWKLSYDGVGWADWYCDPAVSGNRPFRQRQAGFTLSQRIQTGDHIIFPKLDRAFRNTLDALECIESWRERGIIVHFLDIGVNTSTPFGHMMLQLMAVFAEWERERIRTRTNEAKAELRRQNRPTNGQAPLGFQIVKKAGTKGVLVPDETEMLLMKKIYQLRQNGETLKRIGEKFREAGIKPREDPWRKSRSRKRSLQWGPPTVWFYHNSYLKLLKAGRLPAFALPEDSRSTPTDANTVSSVTPSPATAENSSTSPSPDPPPP